MVFTSEMSRKLVDRRWVGRRVAVAMSGGVDSSVAAVLLAKAGCEVVGVTMKLWDFAAVGGDDLRDGRCCTVESFSTCRVVADRFDFPHYTIDLTERFEKDVIGYFVSEYRAGRTPNPCTVCNSRIKWPALWAKVAAFGCEAIATGHYARLRYDDNGGGAGLLRARDDSRDQTYFLWDVSRAELARTVFPLGALLKSEVRELARDFELPNADTPESRDICFVADGDLGRFMSERAAGEGTAMRQGPILDRAGKEIGRHTGIESVTIGQRRGLGVALGRPQYVTAVDARSGTVTMGDEAALYHRQCRLSHVNWLIDPPIDTGTAQIKIRYRHEAAPGRVVSMDDGRVDVVFDRPQRAMTPGQSAVFYDDERVLGGGVIDSVGDA